MDKSIVLLVPERLGVWLESMELGNPKGYFTMIDSLFNYWNNVTDSSLDNFIDDNKKELIEVIIGSREYKVGEPLYYALIKGHELSSNESKYWNSEVYDSGDLFIGQKGPRAKCVNRMTKENWNRLGINESNAEFVKVGEM